MDSSDQPNEYSNKKILRELDDVKELTFEKAANNSGHVGSAMEEACTLADKRNSEDSVSKPSKKIGKSKRDGGMCKVCEKNEAEAILYGVSSCSACSVSFYRRANKQTELGTVEKMEVCPIECNRLHAKGGCLRLRYNKCIEVGMHVPCKVCGGYTVAKHQGIWCCQSCKELFDNLDTPTAPIQKCPSRKQCRGPAIRNCVSCRIAKCAKFREDHKAGTAINRNVSSKTKKNNSGQNKGKGETSNASRSSLSTAAICSEASNQMDHIGSNKNDNRSHGQIQNRPAVNSKTRKITDYFQSSSSYRSVIPVNMNDIVGFKSTREQNKGESGELDVDADPEKLEETDRRLAHSSTQSPAARMDDDEVDVDLETLLKSSTNSQKVDAGEQACEKRKEICSFISSTNISSTSSLADSSTNNANVHDESLVLGKLKKEFENKSGLLHNEYGEAKHFIENLKTRLESQSVAEIVKYLARRYATKFSDEGRRSRNKQMCLQIMEWMKNCGICCGRRFKYTNNYKACNGSVGCLIKKRSLGCFIKGKEEYWEFEDSTTGAIFYYCETSYSNLADVFEIEGRKFEKSKFKKTTNQSEEEMLVCSKCNQLYHPSCKESGLLDDRNCSCGTFRPFSPEKLKITSCSAFIQERTEKHSTDVLIRVVSYCEAEEPLYDDISKFFKENGKTLPKLTYRQRVILAFCKHRETNILTFAIFAKEFGENCESCKAGTVLIDYIDSVEYMEEKRREVYREIVVSYLEYAKRIGYRKSTWWACPPRGKDDYLFNGRPTSGRISLEKLIGWYNKIVIEAGNRGIVCGSKQRLEEGNDDDVFSFITKLYFNNGFYLKYICEALKYFENKEIELTSFKIFVIQRMEPIRDEAFHIQFYEDERTLGPVKILDEDVPTMVSETARSSTIFLHMQRKLNLEFTCDSMAVSSTAKIVELLLNEQK